MYFESIFAAFAAARVGFGFSIAVVGAIVVAVTGAGNCGGVASGASRRNRRTRMKKREQPKRREAGCRIRFLAPLDLGPFRSGPV